MTEEEMVDNMFRLVGIVTPGSPAGKIWASEALIARIGIEKVLEHVRDTYRLAYDRATAG